MYHCRRVTAINGGSTGAIWGIPVENRTSFSVGDLVAVFNPVNNDQITQTSRIYEIIPVAKSNAGTIFMQVCGSGTVGIVFSNLIIQEGFELRTITGLVSSTVSGPFTTCVDNSGNTVQGRGIIEENYNPARHELFNYDVSNTAIPTATACKNASFMLGTPFNTYHFSGVITAGRVNNAPNTGWNGKSCRIAHMLTSQHMILNGHYPLRSDIVYTVDASGNRQTITRRTPQEVGGNPNGSSPYNSAFKNGAISVGQYPFWFALKNPGLDITDVLDVPFETFGSFSEEVFIQAIKTPVNITKPKVPFKKTAKLSGNYHNLNSSTRSVKASACLLVQSSFHRGYIGTTLINGSTLNAAFTVDSCRSDFYTYVNKPAWYNNTDENSNIQTGDSSSLVFWCFDRGGTITPEILLPLTGLFSGTVSNQLNIAGTLNLPATFVGLNGTEVTQTIDQHYYTVTADTGGPGILTENQKKAIEFILRDKSWQITHPNFISANPEKNIYESDIVDTIINWYDVSDPNESLPPITNEQIFTLRSGINLETNNPSFTRFKPEDRFTTENIFNWGTSFEEIDQITAAGWTYRFNLKGYNPLTDEPVGVPQLHSLPQLPAPAESKDIKLPYIVFRRATSSDVIALESNPNTNVSVFRNGGSLLQNNVLTPVDMEFHRSGAKLIKKKLK